MRFFGWFRKPRNVERPATAADDCQQQVEQLNRQVVRLIQQGRYPEAVESAQHARDVARQHLGEDHPDFAASLNNLAELYRAMGNYAQAEPLLRQAMEIRRVALGEDHRDFATSLNNLAGLYIATGRAEQALPLMHQAATIDDRLIGQVFSIGSDSQPTRWALYLDRVEVVDQVQVPEGADAAAALRPVAPRPPVPRLPGVEPLLPALQEAAFQLGKAQADALRAHVRSEDVAKTRPDLDSRQRLHAPLKKGFFALEFNTRIDSLNHILYLRGQRDGETATFLRQCYGETVAAAYLVPLLTDLAQASQGTCGRHGPAHCLAAGRDSLAALQRGRAPAGRRTNRQQTGGV